jgi:hypothetical protein
VEGAKQRCSVPASNDEEVQRGDRLNNFRAEGKSASLPFKVLHGSKYSLDGIRMVAMRHETLPRTMGTSSQKSS